MALTPRHFQGMAGKPGGGLTLPVDARADKWSTRVQLRQTSDGTEQSANYCSGCKSSTCSSGQGGHTGCPFGHNIRDTMSNVANKNTGAALALQLQKTIFESAYSLLCPQQGHCEGTCFNGRNGGDSVAIKSVQQAVAQWGLENGEIRKYVAAARVKKPNGKSIAIIGGGFAGLEAAYHLALNGWKVEVYDANAKPGGLGAYGIPPTKMNYDETMAPSIQIMKDVLGVEFHQNTIVGDTSISLRGKKGAHYVSFDRLCMTHDEVLITTGTPEANDLDFGKLSAGVQPVNVTRGDHFLYWVSEAMHGEFNRDNIVETVRGLNVLVYGGGDTAMDVASMALRSGAESVTVMVRGQARADKKEQIFVTEEGAHILEHHEILKFELGTTGIQFYQNQGEAYEATSAVIRTPDGVKNFDFDACFYATGYSPGPLQKSFSGIEWTEEGLITIDMSGRTSRPNVRAAGDITHGAWLASRSGAHGRRIALAIHNDHFPRVALDSNLTEPRRLKLEL